MDVLEKLTILTDAAKYDAACTSSGVRRGSRPGYIGNTSSSVAGCCHTFSADGRCVTLLKVLMTNRCIYDCKYCVNRRSNDTPRATFTPRELAELTIKLTNSKSRIIYCDLPADDPKQRKPDITLAKKLLDWEPTTSLEEGLKKTIEYFDDLLRTDYDFCVGK